MSGMALGSAMMSQVKMVVIIDQLFNNNLLMNVKFDIECEISNWWSTTGWVVFTIAHECEISH